MIGVNKNNDSTPLISVILPIFNGEDIATRAVKSIKKQTYQNWELLIVDDGSQDNSFHICEFEAKKDKRIRLYRNSQNLGLAKTMNRLLSLAKGVYLAVQEHDDWSAPDRLEREVKFLEANPEVGIVSGIAAWVDKDDQLLAHFPGLLARGEQYPQDFHEMVRYLYVEQCKVVNAGCMVRRSVFDGIESPFDPHARMSIDWQFFLHAAHNIKIWGIPEVLVYMLRDSSRPHMTQQKELQFSEARPCIRVIYDRYRNDFNSPINRALFKKAMTTELVLESRYYGRLKGLMLLLKAFLYNPSNPKVWDLTGWFTRRALEKMGFVKEKI